MKPKDTRFLHIKKAKGKTYGYFNTGKRVNGKLITIPLGRLGADPATFWKLYSTHLGHRKRNPVHITTVGKLIDHFEKLIDNSSRAKSTKDNYASYSKRIREFFADFPAADLRKLDIALWLETIEGTAARKQALTVFRLIYSKGVKAGLTEANPTIGMGIEHTSEPYEPWPEALIDKALECDAPLVRLTVALLFFTGQRISDVAKMTWQDIDGGHIHVVQKKTGKMGKRGKELWIPIHSRLQAILDEYSAGITPIICKPNGKRYQTDYLSAIVSKWSGQDTHGLRKNAVNALLDCGCSVGEVQAITGQSLQMVEHYARQRLTKKSAGTAMKKWDKGC